MKKMKKTKKNWLRGMAMALTLAITLAGTAPSMPAQAAAKNITIKVKSPKTGAKLKGTKLTVHGKKTVQLTVKQGAKTVTNKATYKSANKKVITVNRNGKLTVKKNGKAAVTVKYGGRTKKLNITVAGHNWKAHKKVKKVWAFRWRCACGADRSAMTEKEKYAHTLMHCETHTAGNYHSECYPLNVKYTDYYVCNCGTKKKGQPEPEHYKKKDTYEKEGYTVSEKRQPLDWTQHSHKNAVLNKEKG